MTNAQRAADRRRSAYDIEPELLLDTVLLDISLVEEIRKMPLHLATLHASYPDDPHDLRLNQSLRKHALDSIRTCAIKIKIAAETAFTDNHDLPESLR